MKEDYIQNLLKFEKLLKKLQDQVQKHYFKDGKVKKGYELFCYYPRYRQFLSPIKTAIEISDFLGIEYLEKWKKTFFKWIVNLEEFEGRTLHDFVYLLRIIKKFLQARRQIKETVSLLDSREIDRLNEALHCFLEGCYYSSVAMSVSTIEFRLYSLMMSKCPDSKLEELTLGQLIREYLENKQKYGKVIPKKHEPLLEHCNTYRIFSVHPKKERINKLVASSILNMTFLFLLDKKLKREIKGEGK